MDHGWPDWKELEIPDWATKEYDDLDECVKSYLVEYCRIPTWSERFLEERIKWETITKSAEEIRQINKNKIKALKARIKEAKEKIRELEQFI